jgi:hypothetical protein
MRNRRLPQFLLILAIVVGQWLAVVHATQHELSAPDESISCDICAVAHSGGGLPVVITLFIAFAFREFISFPQPAAVVIRRTVVLPQGRAPPALSR